MRPDDVERAVDALISRVPVPAVDAASTIALGHRRIVRRRIVLTGVSVALIATIAIAGAIANSHHTTSVSSPTPRVAQILDIAVASPDEAWKCTNPLQYTDNGGQTWRKITEPAGAGNPNSLCTAVAGGNAWALQSPNGPRPGPVLRVRTASRSQVFPFLRLPAETHVSSIAFLDADRGWVVTTWIGEIGTGTPTQNLFRTSDGGRTWQLVGKNVPVTGGQFTTRTRGWALASAFDLVTTADSGATWHRAVLPAVPDGSFLAQFVARGSFVVVWGGVVIGGPTRAFFDVTIDGGRTWSRRKGPDGLDLTNASPLGFAAADAVHWRFLAGRLWITDDGGNTWVARRQPTVAPVVHSMSFPTADVGWISGSARGSLQPVILRTTDAGRSWTDVTGNP